MLTSNFSSKKPAPNILMKSNRELLEASKNKNISSEIGASDVLAHNHKLEMANFCTNHRSIRKSMSADANFKHFLQKKRA